MTHERRVVFIREAVATAKRLYFAKRMSEAGALCAQILQRRPNQFDALYLSGLVAYRVGNRLAAHRFIEQACRVRPEITHYDHLTGLLRQQGTETWWSVRHVRLKQFYKISSIQGFIISYPKCGRTWIGIMLGRYLLRGRKGNPLEILELTQAAPSLPNIEVSHDDYPHLKPYMDLYEDKSMYHDKAVVFLVRDPRDVLVSNYFQYTKRGDKELANDADFCGTLSDFICHKIGGLVSIVRFYNIWARNRDVPKRFHLLRYEDLHSNTHGEFVRLIAFFHLPDLGQNAIDDAVSFGAFDNMRRLEETNALNSWRLRPPPDGDSEGFKLRRGVVGGYRDYLSGKDIAFIDDYLRTELDDFYVDYKQPSRNRQTRPVRHPPRAH